MAAHHHRAVRLFIFLDLSKRVLRKASRPKQIFKPLVAEIFILQRQINIQRLDHCHCCLQIITLFAGNTNFLALNRGLCFQLGTFDGFDNFLRNLAMHALPYLHRLPNAVAASLLGLFKFQSLGVYTFTGKMGDDQFFNLTAL